jgi:hypothetical protein
MNSVDGERPEEEQTVVAQLAGEDTAPGDRDVRTGADQPWDPEDLAIARGLDPTPNNVERARHLLDEEGPAAIEKTVP